MTKRMREGPFTATLLAGGALVRLQLASFPHSWPLGAEELPALARLIARVAEHQTKAPNRTRREGKR